MCSMDIQKAGLVRDAVLLKSVTPSDHRTLYTGKTAFQRLNAFCVLQR